MLGGWEESLDAGFMNMPKVTRDAEKGRKVEQGNEILAGLKLLTPGF